MSCYLPCKLIFDVNLIFILDKILQIVGAEQCELNYGRKKTLDVLPVVCGRPVN